MSVGDFRSCERNMLRISRAIALSSRISVSDVPSSTWARRDENIFVSEINFNDGVIRGACGDPFESPEFINLSEGEARPGPKGGPADKMTNSGASLQGSQRYILKADPPDQGLDATSN